MLSGYSSPDIDVEDYPWPAAPPSPDGETDVWTAARVRAAIAVLAGKEDPAVYRQDLFYYRVFELMEADKLAAKGEAYRARLEAGRVLLGDKDMNRIHRYESHYRRDIQANLHELEALQARRRGQPTPMVRVRSHGRPQGLKSRDTGTAS